MKNDHRKVWTQRHHFPAGSHITICIRFIAGWEQAGVAELDFQTKKVSPECHCSGFHLHESIARKEGVAMRRELSHKIRTL